MTTNYEQIKNMTVEEMAEELHNINRSIWKGIKKSLFKGNIELIGFNPVHSKEAIEEWLQSESSNQ